MNTTEQIIHSELQGHMRRHKEANKLGFLMAVDEPNTESDLFDFEVTHFPTRQKFYTPATLVFLSRALLRTNGRQLGAAFTDEIDDIEQSVKERRLLLITGHDDMYEPMAAAHGLQYELTRRSGIKKRDLAKKTHVLGVRTTAYGSLFGRFPLIRIAQSECNFHPTFPDNKTYRGKDSKISKDFLATYGNRMLENFRLATAEVGSIAILAASSKDDELVNGEYVMQRVKHGLIKRIITTGWDVMFVAGYKENKKRRLSVSSIIPSAQVNRDVTHAGMSWIAKQKTSHGRPTVYADN